MSAVDRALLVEVVRLACRAPSVHNTQPWAWRITGTSTLELYEDPSRRLPLADPDGRSSAVSCGAVLQHAVASATALGATCAVDLAPPDSEALAVVMLTPGTAPDDARASLDLMRDRYTDRRRFTAWPIPAARLLELSVASSAWGAYVVPLTDPGTRDRVEVIMGRARAVQAADPSYARELDRWVDRGPGEGISRAGASPVSDARGNLHPTRYQPDPGDVSQIVHGTDGLLAICTNDDTRTSWTRAGETLAALWLDAHRSGLSVVPLSQVIEVPETRRALRDEALQGGPWPQLMVRVGWQQISRTTLPRTERRALGDVLTG